MPPKDAKRRKSSIHSEEHISEMPSKFELMVEKAIPSDFRMISSWHHVRGEELARVEKMRRNFAGKLTSESSLKLNDGSKLMTNSHFALPANTTEKSNGSFTHKFLSCLLDAHKDESIKTMSWATMIKRMRDTILYDDDGSTQLPQLSSSRLLDVNSPFKIINDSTGSSRSVGNSSNSTSTSISNSTTNATDSSSGNTPIKRAVMIGINYAGQNGELFGRHDDVKDMIAYLKTYQGFEDENIAILMDDGENQSPTYKNIMTAFRRVVRQSKPGDTVFLHYSGHSGRVDDMQLNRFNNCRPDHHETIIPVDYFIAGQIIDDDLYHQLVTPMMKGVLVTALMDCFQRSDTILDLPYHFKGHGDAMGRNFQFCRSDDEDTSKNCCSIS